MDFHYFFNSDYYEYQAYLREDLFNNKYVTMVLVNLLKHIYNSQLINATLLLKIIPTPF